MQENSANKSGKGKEQKEEQKILWIAGALAIFGCFAPIIFTRTKLFEWLDFSNTGEIGDTIGGTMTPIVSLAAVILTYLAFLKQVEANKIQTEQFNKTLQQKETDDKKQLKNSLELMSLDVDFAIQDMEERIKNFDDYLKDERKRIYGEGFLRYIPTASLTRYRTIDRNHLYNAYKLYADYKNKKELFRKTYSLLDYYSEKVKEIMPILDDNMQRSNLLHDKITKELENFEDMLDKYGDANFSKSDKRVIESFNKEVFQCPNKEWTLFTLDCALKHHESDFAEIFYDEIKESFFKLKELTSDVKSVNEVIVSEINDVKKKWENETLKELGELRDVLHKSLGVA
ncbi:MAG: hypothetical protein IKX43_05660 [Paludibacteraceae bacterium]|nr:hypothetical protein [Paludibacteraceae bacterium]